MRLGRATKYCEQDLAFGSWGLARVGIRGFRDLGRVAYWVGVLGFG